MEFWRYSPVLRNDIREHNNHEKKIIENARQAIQSVSKLYVINSINDVINALKKIYEHDTFGYDTDLNSANGMMLKTICEAINKYKETDYELKARCNDEELTFKDNQEKEDKILYRLNSIDEHIVQGNEKIEAATNKQPDQNDPIENEVDNHAFIKILKEEHPVAYTAIKNGLGSGLIEYKNKRFNFKCDKGCVGLVFWKSGYTAYKQIVRYILINGEEPKEITLRNCTSNSPPNEWESIKKHFFPIMTK
jgi:hypothetical protein